MSKLRPALPNSLAYLERISEWPAKIPEGNREKPAVQLKPTRMALIAGAEALAGSARAGGFGGAIGIERIITFYFAMSADRDWLVEILMEISTRISHLLCRPATRYWPSSR